MTQMLLNKIKTAGRKPCLINNLEIQKALLEKGLTEWCSIAYVIEHTKGCDTEDWLRLLCEAHKKEDEMVRNIVERHGCMTEWTYRILEKKYIMGIPGPIVRKHLPTFMEFCREGICGKEMKRFVKLQVKRKIEKAEWRRKYGL